MGARAQAQATERMEAGAQAIRTMQADGRRADWPAAPFFPKKFRKFSCIRDPALFTRRRAAARSRDGHEKRWSLKLQRKDLTRVLHRPAEVASMRGRKPSVKIVLLGV